LELPPIAIEFPPVVTDANPNSTELEFNLMFPPIYTFPLIPTPPLTINAPLEVEVDEVVL
jgi:hypothetical protein